MKKNFRLKKLLGSRVTSANEDLRLETEIGSAANMVFFRWYEALKAELDDPDTRRTSSGTGIVRNLPTRSITDRELLKWCGSNP